MQNQEETNFDNFKNRLNTKPLNLLDVMKKISTGPEISRYECLVCDKSFDLASTDIKVYLTHLLTQHQLVISDADQIGHFQKFSHFSLNLKSIFKLNCKSCSRYIKYWKDRLASLKIEDICFKINTNTGKNDKGI